MVTTIQLNENVKNALDRIKSKKETYEDVIVKMIKEINEQKRKHTELMIEEAKETAQESLKITKEFEGIENLDNWDW